MSIYLAWSIYKLVGMLLLWAVVFTLLFWKVVPYTSDPVFFKKVAIGGVLVWLLAIIGGALNVGQRQSELQRQSFDATMPPAQQEQAIKQQKHDIDSVKATFEQAVKQTKE